MLPLPQKFKEGFSKKVSSVYPIVVIDASAQATGGEFIIRLSQSKGVFDGEYYEDRFLSVSGIIEKVDLLDKKFQINQVNIEVSNYTIEQIRFSEKFMTAQASSQFINSKVDIYYANESCQTLEDCLKIFSGFVKSFSAGIEKVTFSIEDHSQYTVTQKHLPRYSTYDTTSETIDMSKNAYFPVVYGHHEKCPMIFTRPFVGDVKSYIFPDSVFRAEINILGFTDNENPMYIFRDDHYHQVSRIFQMDVPSSGDFIVNGFNYLDPIQGYQGTAQYELSEESTHIILEKQISDHGHTYGLKKNMQARDQFLVESQRLVTGISADSSEGSLYNYGDEDGEQVQYIGAWNGFNPVGENNQFHFPEVSMPASYIEIGYYKDLVFRGFNYNRYDNNREHDSLGGSTEYSLYYLVSILYGSSSVPEIMHCEATDGGNLGFDLIYKPSIQEVKDLLLFETNQYGYSPSDVHWINAFDEANYGHGTPGSYTYNGFYWGQDGYYYAQQVGWTPAPNGDHPANDEGHSGSLAGLYLYSPGVTQYSLLMDDVLSQSTLDNVFRSPNIYKWIQDAGEDVTLRKILWGRRVTDDESVLGTTLNLGTWVYGMFPTLGYNVIKSQSGYSRWWHWQSDEHSSNPHWYAGFGKEFILDSLYSFKNPYIDDPEYSSVVTAVGLSRFYYEDWNFDQLTIMPHKTYGDNTGVPIIDYDTTDPEYQVGGGAEYWWNYYGDLGAIEKWSPEMTGQGTIAMYGGNWCPIDCVIEEMDAVKLNLTFNSISGQDVILGGVYSKVKGKVDVDFFITSTDGTEGENPSFIVECDALYPTGNHDHIIEKEDLRTSMSIIGIDDETGEPSSFSTFSTGFQGEVEDAGLAEDGVEYLTTSDSALFDSEGPRIIDTECTAYTDNEDQNQWRQNVNSLNTVSLIYQIRGGDTSNATSGSFRTRISNFELNQQFILGNTSQQKYFCDIYGRVDNEDARYTDNVLGWNEVLDEDGNPLLDDDGNALLVMDSNWLITRPSDILMHIMETEFGYFNVDDFDQESVSKARAAHSDWKFEFAITEKTDAPDFLSDFSKSTKLIPRFRHDGTFGFISLPGDSSQTGEPNMTIKATDVLDFEYSKTPISEVKIMVNVKYMYDSGLNSYQASTNFGNSGAVPKDLDQLMHMYGVESVYDAFLDVESRYIRDEHTAKELRNYLLEWFKNQHNVITCSLSPYYMNLECGDVVNFDSLIKDMTIFGQDYTEDFYINNSEWGQMISKNFVVSEINKSQSQVKVKLVQIHLSNHNNIREEWAGSTGGDFWIPPEIGIGDEPEEITVNLGDVNFDEALNVLDIVMLINIILGQGVGFSGLEMLVADVNQDTVVNILDVVLMVNAILSGGSLGTITIEV